MKITTYQRIQQLLNSDKIKVYTYQNIKVLSHLAEHGYITGEHNYSYAKRKDEKRFPGEREFFEKPYIWMQKQMKKRIKKYSGDLPIWGWVESRGAINVYKRFGDNQVKITANIPLSRCLISDFDLYEGGPMNKSYYSTDIKKMEAQYTQINEEEYDKNHKVGIKYAFEPTESQLEKSWEMIFDLSKNWGTKEARKFLGIDSKGRYLQVCVDRIYQNEIEHIKVYDNIVEKKR